MEPKETITVDLDRVNRVIKLVGMLVIDQTKLLQLGADLPAPLCSRYLSRLERLAQHLRDLQDGVIAIRAQPIRTLFEHMPQLIRTRAAQRGKDARLVLRGEDTEIDTSMIGLLEDLLTPLINNALEHGLEPPAERIRRGKPPIGTIELSVVRRSGGLVIGVADDGRGLDRAQIATRARARGLVAADAVLSRDEIDGLIFLPGFSTAPSSSNRPRRGAGMNAVQRSVQALGGYISVASQRGKGARFTLVLPGPCGVVEGTLIVAGTENYILPFAQIVSCLRHVATAPR